jgi:hypothetical protein
MFFTGNAAGCTLMAQSVYNSSVANSTTIQIENGVLSGGCVKTLNLAESVECFSMIECV